MTNEELAQAIEVLRKETNENYTTLLESHQKLSKRINTIDLNGAASHLRDFGHFLADHPDFMKREANEESERVRREIALQWIAEVLHLRNWKRKLAFVGGSVFTGLLLQYGANAASLTERLGDLLYYVGHGVFK